MDWIIKILGWIFYPLGEIKCFLKENFPETIGMIILFPVFIIYIALFIALFLFLLWSLLWLLSSAFEKVSPIFKYIFKIPKSIYNSISDKLYYRRLKMNRRKQKKIMEEEEKEERKRELEEEKHKTKIMSEILNRESMYSDNQVLQSENHAKIHLNTFISKAIENKSSMEILMGMALKGDRDAQKAIIELGTQESKLLLEDGSRQKEIDSFKNEIKNKNKKIAKLEEKTERIDKAKKFKSREWDIKHNNSISEDAKDQLLQELYAQTPDWLELLMLDFFENGNK